MLLSIIIPCYNSDKTIRRLLNSLTYQKFKDFEVIIIDDCSTDNSKEVIASYKENSNLDIILLSTGVNSGPAIARNIGINNAKGDYICFIDSDDYISEDYTYELRRLIKRDCSDLIYFGCTQIIGNKTIIGQPRNFDDKKDFVALSSGSLCMFTFKKELLQKFPSPHINNAEDIAIIPLLISSANKISFSDKNLYYYVHSNNSLSSSHSPNVTYNFIKSFEYTLSYLKPPYNKGIEFHGIKTLLYGAILNGIKAKMTHKELRDIIDSFERNFPDWKDNEYISSYPFRKRLFLKLVSKRNFLLMNFYTYIHSLLLRYL